MGGICSGDSSNEDPKVAGEPQKLDISKFEKLGAKLKENDEARAQFKKFDANGDGILQRDELMLVAMWVYEKFNEKPPTYAVVQNYRDRLLKYQAGEDKVMTWDEFCEWYDKVEENSQKAKLHPEQSKSLMQEVGAATPATATVDKE